MNIYDVSKKAGVSIATVSRVINGNPKVSEKTKQKVLAIMDEIGYTPNVFARGLGLNTMKTIGIMCTDLSDPFLANAVYYIEQELRKNGYESFLCCTGYELKNKQNNLHLLLSKRIDAIIIVGSNFLELGKKDNSYIVDAAKDVPVILINGFIDSYNIYCTLCDDYKATYDTTTLLLKQGREHILFLYTFKTYSAMEKMNGFKNAVFEFTKKKPDDYIHSCKGTIADAKELILKLSKEGLQFDAIVTSDDILAVGAIKYAKACKRKIPSDISVVGYNNSVLSICCDPELTSIDNHVETLCLTSINTLMHVLDGKKAPNKTSISNDIIKRDTTDFTF